MESGDVATGQETQNSALASVAPDPQGPPEGAEAGRAMAFSCPALGLQPSAVGPRAAFRVHSWGADKEGLRPRPAMCMTGKAQWPSGRLT